VTLGVLGGALYFLHAKETGREFAVSVTDDVLMQARADVSEFHGLFHERLSGDADVKPGDALAPLESASAGIRLLLDGGVRNGLQVPALTDPSLRAETDELAGLAGSIEEAAKRGFSGNAATAFESEAMVDAAHDRSMALFDDLDRKLNAQRDSAFAASRTYASVMLAIWVFVTMLLAVGSAVTARWRLLAEMELRKFQKAVDQSQSCIIITDLDARIEYVNPRFTELTGYTLEEAVGQNPRILKSGRTPQKVYEELWASLTAGKPWRGDFLNKKKNGDFYWEAASIAPITDESGAVTGYVAVKEDITARKKEQDERERLLKRLEDALKNVKTLSGLLPICSYCKKIRDDSGFWQKVETYVQEHTEAEFTHGICEQCAEKVIKDAKREAGRDEK
jgi:PAS domain S-box-containing protein